MLEPGQKIRIKWKEDKNIRLIVDNMLDNQIFHKNTEDDVFVKEINGNTLTLRFPDGSLGDVNRAWISIKQKVKK